VSHQNWFLRHKPLLFWRMEVHVPDQYQSNDQHGLASDSANCLTLTRNKVIYCDAGYGFPSEARPRREKLLAIAKQIVNFLTWQRESSMDFAEIVIVGSDELNRSALVERMKQLLKGDIPLHVTFSSKSLDSFTRIVYLSPDADERLDPSIEPPDQVVVGLLIDRRIQANRSKRQAASLGIQSARLALDEFNIDRCEPLNVDTVLVGMQQWWWNCEQREGARRECFLEAMEKSLQQHCTRHPNRPLHKPLAGL
jgi:hypothetical protein